MKKLIFAFAMLVCGLAGLQAQNVTVSGRIFDSGTGGGVGNFPVEVLIVDSLTSTIAMQGTFQTDSLGDYVAVFSTANGPFPAYGEVRVFDCHGAMQSLHFNFPNGGATYSHFDFWLCVPAPGCNAAFIAASTNGGLEVIFHDQSTSSPGQPAVWDWLFGDGTSGSGLNISHTYPAAGTYLVCLTMHTTLGCSATFCDSVVVGSVNSACQAGLGYGLLPSGAYGFSATAIGSATPISYSYDFGDGLTLVSFHDTVAYSYANSGSYTACVTVLFSDSCMATSCVNVVSPNLNCQADFGVIPDTTGQYSLLLVNNSWGNGLNYHWDFGDGGTSNAAYPQHTYAGPGTYLICLMVSDTTNTCTSTFCDSVVVTNKLGAAFTIQVVPGILTAAPAPSLESNTFAVYPNPARDFVHVDAGLARAGLLSYEIMDMNGRRLMGADEGLRAQGLQSLQIPVSQFPAGIYFLRVQVGQSSKIEKLLIGN